jgi:Tfp pilus assembly ATPase PilU
MDELKLPSVLKELAMTKRGIIIFVGATGTGKSTSLASMIGYRNQNSKVILLPLKTQLNLYINMRVVLSLNVKSGLIQIHLKSH